MTAKTVYVNGLQLLSQKLDPRSTFIGHPFFGSDVIKRADYRLPITDSLTERGYQPIFPDEVVRPGMLLSNLAQQILDSGASIFDLTSCNPNVLIELGLAIGMNRPLLTIVESPGPRYPAFVEELEPLRYTSPARLGHTIFQSLEIAIQEYVRSGLRRSYCVACRQDCASRHNVIVTGQNYRLIGASRESDELLVYNLEQAIKQFGLTRDETSSVANCAACVWVEQLRRARFALFVLPEPEHAQDYAEVFLQVGVAAGIGLPWTFILRSGKERPSDLQGLTYVQFLPSPLPLFRAATSNAVKGILIASHPELFTMQQSLKALDGIEDWQFEVSLDDAVAEEMPELELDEQGSDFATDASLSPNGGDASMIGTASADAVATEPELPDTSQMPEIVHDTQVPYLARHAVRRIRVVRQVKVGGQVVEETAAEEFIDADADPEPVRQRLQEMLRLQAAGRQLPNAGGTEA